ncbi:MAG: CobD/CbiB family protein [Rhodocyclales bacterium]|nr:CobD/CbiB family protein [Rhodocyclales bacterium]
MTLFAIIVALVLEQIHALPIESAVRRPIAGLAAMLEEKFNDGGRNHGALAWGLGTALPATLLSLAHALLWHFQPLAAVLLGIGTLYLTVGFRQFSHFFTGIHLALRQGELDEARRLLAEWRGRSGDRLSSGDIARLAIEQALLDSHRHVFAPLLWFAVLGPAGALFYRLAYGLDQHWGRRGEAEFGEFGLFARQAFHFIDWVPIRVTAASFAVVGDFEGAAHCWRTQAVSWPEAGSGILLASGAGALGVRLGMPVHDSVLETGELADRPELGLGEDADPDFMQSTIGLVWRSLVLALLVLALIWVSGWVGV